MSGFSVLTTQASLTVGKLICKLKSKSIPRDLSLARTLAATKLFLLMLISALKSSSDEGCNIEIDDKNFENFKSSHLDRFQYLSGLPKISGGCRIKRVRAGFFCVF